MKLQVNGPLPKSGGNKLEYLEKTPDNQPENQYIIHIIITGEIHHPNQASNPHPLTLVIKFVSKVTTWGVPIAVPKDLHEDFSVKLKLKDMNCYCGICD